ncbi:MAG: DUF5060 domain-containing protein [Acidobacteria bacterium]|nr:DUF5060 domain-containing protein [Acidobacteriota bacterium]
MDQISRRRLLGAAAVGAAASKLLPAKEKESPGAAAMTCRRTQHPAAPLLYATARSVTEWSIDSGKSYADPFNEVELDVVFSDTDGHEWRVPAFWGGGQTWRVRGAPQSGPIHFPNCVLRHQESRPP